MGNPALKPKGYMLKDHAGKWWTLMRTSHMRAGTKCQVKPAFGTYLFSRWKPVTDFRV